MKYILIALAILLSACNSPAYPDEAPLKFSVEINGVVRNDASQERIDKCDSVIREFANRYTDMWYEQMEQCLFLDADYLVDFNDEGPVAEGDI